MATAHSKGDRVEVGRAFVIACSAAAAFLVTSVESNQFDTWYQIRLDTSARERLFV